MERNELKTTRFRNKQLELFADERDLEEIDKVISAAKEEPYIDFHLRIRKAFNIDVEVRILREQCLKVLESTRELIISQINKQLEEKKNEKNL